VSSTKRAGRHRKPPARHRKRVAHNRQRAARNGIAAATLGLGLAVTAGQGLAAAAPDESSPDAPAKGSSAHGAGTSSQTKGATSTGAKGTAGPKRTRPSTKPSSAGLRPSPARSAATPAVQTTATVEDTAGTPQPEKATTLAAKTVSAAATPAEGTGAWYFMGVLSRAVDRLASWPGPPRNFVTLTNHLTDQNLDAIDDQLDALIAGAVAGSPARWIPDLSNIFGLFFTSAIPSYGFTDFLNAAGDFLNRIVPPFNIAPGAGTFGIITQYKIMGAAVVGTATVLTDMLNGVYDPAQWEIDVIKTTTGATVTRADLSDSVSLEAKIAAAQAAAIVTFGLSDGGAYYDPERAWNITLPTWTAAQVNPFTVVAYVALVAMYKRFQEMAVLTEFTTSTTYDSWLYTLSLGSDSTRSEYAAGTFHAVDPDGRAVDFGTSLLGTYTSAGGGLVTINTSDGGFTYTNTLPGKAFFHRATSENVADRYDTVNVPVTSADGADYTLTFKIQIIDGSNSAPTSSPTMGAADGLGVVRGNVGGSDSDGDTLTYSLVGSSVNGLNNNSAYTKNGAGNGGIVTLNATTGAFTYVSSATAGATQSFQVQMTDGHGAATTATVTVPNTTSITPGNLNTATPYVVTGSVPVPGGDAGMFTSYALGASPAKGTVTSFNPVTGAFTYTSGAGRTTANSDVVTVIATDANGRTVTLKLAVKPAVVNSAPVGTGVTTDSPVGAPTYNVWGGPSDDQNTTGALHASDADGDSVSYAAGTYTTANGGSVTVSASGAFSYSLSKFAPFGVHNSYWHTHAADGDPGDTFTITVTDAFGATSAVTYSIPIAKLNAAPTLAGTVNGTPTVDGLGVRRGSINTGSDDDGDSLTYSLVGASGGSAYTAGGGIVTMTGTSFTYVPKVGVASDSFQVQVNDGHGGITTATVSLTGLTTPGTSTGVVRTTLGTETGTLSIPSPSDTTGLGLTYSVATNPSKGTVTLINTGGVYTYTYVRTAGLGHSTSLNDSFTVKATDASGKSVTVATINVAPNIANFAPAVTVTTPATVGTRVGTTQSTSGAISWSDADGDALTINGQTAPVGTGTITLATRNGGTVVLKGDGTYTYTRTVTNTQSHAAARVGAADSSVNDYIDVTVTDIYGGSTALAVKVPVYATNAAPGTTSGGTRWGNYWTGVGNASDGDGDDVSYVVTSTQGTATYDSFWLTLSTSGASSGAVVTITVYDGSYVVSGGAVTGVLSSNSRTYTVA
jgi:VCBS repeat-containing protein